ncbi:MAG TPA: hypothetical protein VEA78_12525 [Acidimicrobiales bacterium]|nr:hypothetical protein [Acidimicrobiales bacterium]
MRRLVPAVLLATVMVVACSDGGACAESRAPYVYTVLELVDRWERPSDDELVGRDAEGSVQVRAVRDGRDVVFPRECDLTWTGRWDLLVRVAEGDESARRALRALHDSEPDVPWEGRAPTERVVADAPADVRARLVDVRLLIDVPTDLGAGSIGGLTSLGWTDGIPATPGVADLTVFVPPAEELALWWLPDDGGARHLVATVPAAELHDGAIVEVAVTSPDRLRDP